MGFAAVPSGAQAELVLEPEPDRLHVHLIP